MSRSSKASSEFRHVSLDCWQCTSSGTGLSKYSSSCTLWQNDTGSVRYNIQLSAHCSHRSVIIRWRLMKGPCIREYIILYSLWRSGQSRLQICNSNPLLLAPAGLERSNKRHVAQVINWLCGYWFCVDEKTELVELKGQRIHESVRGIVGLLNESCLWWLWLVGPSASDERIKIVSI